MFNLLLKVKNVSADRVLISREFQTADAAAENACEEKTVLTCGRSVVQLQPNVILLLDDTPQFRR